MNDQVKKEKSELSRLQNNLIDQGELLKEIEHKIRSSTEASEQAMFKADHDALTEAEYKVKTSQGTREKVVKYIEDLKSEIENQHKVIEDAETQVLRDQLADEKEKTLSKQKQYAKTAYRDLKKALESITAIRDMSKENNADSDRLISAVVSSEMYHSCPFLFKTEYQRNDRVTALKVLPVVNGALGREFKSSDEAVPFDEAFQELILNPITEEIEGLRAGKVDLPEAKSEPVEIKPKPRLVRKSIYVLKHFYATYEGLHGDPDDKPFYAYKKYIVPEDFAVAIIADGYALDTSDPDYPDKLKRHEYTVTDKPIMEHEVSLKNTPHLGDPGGFL